MTGLTSFLFRFGHLIAVTATIWILGLIPELSELGWSVEPLLGVLLVAALVTAPVRQDLPSRFSIMGSAGLMLIGLGSSYGRELFPGLGVAGGLLGAAWLFHRLSLVLVNGPARTRESVERLCLGLQFTGLGVLVGDVARRAGFDLPEQASHAVARGTAWIGSRLGDPWRAHHEWLFPPGETVHVDSLSAGLPIVLVLFSLYMWQAIGTSVPLGNFCRGLAITAVYLPVRLLAWTWFVPQQQVAGPGSFHSFFGGGQLLMVVPLAVLLAASIRDEPSEGEIPTSLPPNDVAPICETDGAGTDRLGRPALALAMVLGACLALIAVPTKLTTAPLPAGVSVVIDETRSDWEPVVVRYDERTAQPIRQNNYVSMARFLWKLVPVEVWKGGPDLPGRPVRDLDESLQERVSVKTGKLDWEHLSQLLEPNGSPVLVLKCPTIPYAAGEVEAIVRFVEQGGGLLMFGEHSDAFFINTHLNAVAQRFGIRFLADEHYDGFGSWIETDRSCYETGSFIAALGPFLWATNCTLQVKAPAFDLVRSRFATFTEPGNYFNSSFFGNRRLDVSDHRGKHSMMAAARYGKGKVLAFTDSTSFNNSYWAFPDRRLLWYLWLDWFASGDEGWFEGPWTLLWLWPSLLLLLLASTVFASVRRLLEAVLLGAGLVCVLAPGMAAAPVDLTYLDSLDPARVLIDVSLGSRHSVGREEPVSRNPDHAIYSTAVEELASMSMNARIDIRSASLPAARGNAELVIVISPLRQPGPDQVQGYVDFVRSGGRLLLIEGVTRSRAMVPLADAFGLEFSRVPLAIPGRLSWPSPGAIYTSPDGGGRTLWTLGDRPVLAGVTVGEGYVAALSDDRLLAKVGRSSPASEVLDLFRETVRHLLSAAPAAGLASLSAEAAIVGKSSSREAGSVPPEGVPKLRRLVRSALPRLVPGRRSSPEASDALVRLRQVNSIRESLGPTGPVAIATWPLPLEAAAGDRGPVQFLASSRPVRRRLFARLESLAAGSGRVEWIDLGDAGGHRKHRHQAEEHVHQAAPPLERPSGLDRILVVHASSLVARDRSSSALPGEIEALLSWLDSARLDPARLILLPPETVEQSLLSALLVSMVALGPDEVGRWQQEAEWLAGSYASLMAEDFEAVLSQSGRRLGKTVLPDVHLSLLGLAAASLGQRDRAASWLGASSRSAPLLSPIRSRIVQLLK